MKISESEISVLEWDEVVERINLYNPTIQIVNEEITRKISRWNNYVSGMVRSKSIFVWKLPYVSTREFYMDSMFFYVLRLALNGIVFDSNCVPVRNVRYPPYDQIVKKKLKSRFQLIGIILFLFSPFILFYRLLYFGFHYMQTVRAEPGDLSRRQLTSVAKYKAVDFDEPPHMFDQRIQKSYEMVDLYLSQFESSSERPLKNALSFICGSVIAIVFFIGLLTDMTCVLSLRISKTRTVTWLVTVLGAIYASCQPNVIVQNTLGLSIDEMLDRITELVHIDFKNGRTGHSWQAYYNVQSAYYPIWKQILSEIIGTIIDPILFGIILPEKTEAIVGFIRDGTVETEMGIFCSAGKAQTSEQFFPDIMDKYPGSGDRNNAGEGIINEDQEQYQRVHSNVYEQDTDTRLANSEHFSDENLIGFL